MAEVDAPGLMVLGDPHGAEAASLRGAAEIPGSLSRVLGGRTGHVGHLVSLFSETSRFWGVTVSFGAPAGVPLTCVRSEKWLQGTWVTICFCWGCWFQ